MSLLPTHVTVRQYDPDAQIPREEIERMVALAQKASSSNFRQAYSIVWLSDEETRRKVGELSDNVSQFTTAGAAFIICADYYRLKLACEKHGTEIVADTVDNVLLGASDAAIFAERLSIIAEMMGYSICYIGGIRRSLAKIDALLQLPELTFPLFGLTIGRPAPDITLAQEKPRLPVQLVLHENVYAAKEDAQALLDEYDVTSHDYFLNRSSNNRDSTWTKDMAASCSAKRPPKAKAVISAKGFDFN